MPFFPALQSAAAAAPATPTPAATGSGLTAETSAWFLASALEVTLAICLAAGLFWGLLILKARLKQLAESPQTGGWLFGTQVARLVSGTSTIFLGVLAIAAVVPFTNAPASLADALQRLFVIASSLQVAFWVRDLLLRFLEGLANRRGDDETVLANAMGLVAWLVNLAIWSIAFLIILSNLGVDVTALIAGLGIGGIAIGLAAQGIVSDLFAALSILFDRPFVKGDFIVVGETMGEVEEIGLKTTRIRSLGGHQVVVANNALLARDVHNFRRMQERRVVFTLAIDYETQAALVKVVPDILREAIRSQALTRFDRAHLRKLGDHAFEYEAAYYVLSRDYQQYMDIHQAILLQIIDQLEAQEIAIALPPGSQRRRLKPPAAA